VPLPETIAVRYTEEEAGYVTMRPLVQQTFRMRELADMVLRVTGKDAARVRQILRAGTVVYNTYRYWWPGFETAEDELAALLAGFPEDDPSRAFREEECTAVLLEYGGGTAQGQVEVTRKEASSKPFWQRRSLWEVLAPPKSAAIAYAGYSYAHAGDLYRQALTIEESWDFLSQAAALAPRHLRARLERLPVPLRLVYVCPRK
jgi:hypothetical protein